MSQSIWENFNRPQFEPLSVSCMADCCVVGTGIGGLSLINSIPLLD